MIVKIKVDGNEYEAREGDRIIDVCRKLNIYIPNLCYLGGGIQSSSTKLSCGLCVVELESGALVSACVGIIKQGISIKTNSQRVSEMRCENMNEILRSHDTNCFNCPKGGRCTLQSTAATIYLEAKRYTGMSLESLCFTRPPDNVPQQSLSYGDLIFSPGKCIRCSKCTTFLSKIRGSVVTMQEMLSNAADPKRSDDFFLNVIDNCPTAALLIKSSSTNIEKEVITFDVSNIFTSPILVSKVQDKIRAVSSMKAHWISDETRKLPEKLCMRKQISSEKSYRKGLNQVLKSITSGERMIFLLGASIDIISFQQLRNITEKFPNCVLCLDALWSPNEINIELKFDRDTILSTQFALLIGSSKGIDICDLYANLPNLRKVESVSLQDLTEFLQQYQGIQNLYTYNSPKFFLHSDLLGGRAFQDVLDTINNFATDYEQQIGKTPEIKVLPRSMTQIMIGDIDGYLNLSQLRDTRDIRFICIIGEVTQAARQIIDELYHDDDPIEIIQFSPFDQGYASFVPTRHFLEDSAQYLNIFGDIVETKACCNTALKSNRELTEDMGCMLTQLDKHVNGYRIA